MKKIIIAAALVLGFAVAASAQPRALGVRIGNGGEISYQHNLNGENFIEAVLGLGGFSYLNVAGTYNFMIAQPAWTNAGEWGFYAGPGIALGAGQGIFNVGIAAQVGLEYTFDFPLQISVDLRPQIGMVSATANDVTARAFGVWGWYPHLGIRYRF